MSIRCIDQSFFSQWTLPLSYYSHAATVKCMLEHESVSPATFSTTGSSGAAAVKLKTDSLVVTYSASNQQRPNQPLPLHAQGGGGGRFAGANIPKSGKAQVVVWEWGVYGMDYGWLIVFTVVAFCSYYSIASQKQWLNALAYSSGKKPHDSIFFHL